MFNFRQTTKDIRNSLELLDDVYADSSGRIHIKSTDRVLSPAEINLPVGKRNICEIIASFRDGTLYTYLIQKQDGSLPAVNLSRMTVEHRRLEGECMCFLIPSQDANGIGNVSLQLEALETQCHHLTIDLSKIAPILQFLLLCRVALRLPLPGRFQLLRAGYRFNSKTWMDGETEGAGKP
jgi:hypothetical protein